jgi:hypothetical protein
MLSAFSAPSQPLLQSLLWAEIPLRLWGVGTKYVYIKSTTVYVPSSVLERPHPFSASECAPPPGTKGGGHSRLRVRGGGASIPTTGEKA